MCERKKERETERNMKGTGEVSWSGANVIFVGVQERERARERVAVLLNDVWRSVVVKSVD